MSIKVTYAGEGGKGLTFQEIPEGEFYIRDGRLLLKLRGGGGAVAEFPCGKLVHYGSGLDANRRLVDVELIARERK